MERSGMKRRQAGPERPGAAGAMSGKNLSVRRAMERSAMERSGMKRRQAGPERPGAAGAMSGK
jgi:hypothetical protein